MVGEWLTMDMATRIFWITTAVLLAAATFFGVKAHQHEGAQVLRDTVLESGDVVYISTVVDGGTVVVYKEDLSRATVRLLGIKAFEAKLAKDEQAVQGRSAADALRLKTSGVLLRVLANAPPRDRQGLTLATLYAGAEDLGLWMVSQGHAMVDTVYPFSQMPQYLAAQQAARQKRLGLWSSRALRDQADALAAQWGRSTP
jgi:endonuclease YncB( thermonuclease family)